MLAGETPVRHAARPKPTATYSRRYDAAAAQPSVVLSEQEVKLVLAGTAHAVHYICRPLGSIMIKLDGHYYEFVCTRFGRQYYRCFEQYRCACNARILKTGQSVYVIGSGRHSHPAPQQAPMAGMSEHVLKQHPDKNK